MMAGKNCPIFGRNYFRRLVVIVLEVFPDRRKLFSHIFGGLPGRQKYY
jgi:hypothetical protein